MNSLTIPHPPNASWMPPVDPNDEVQLSLYSYYRTLFNNNKP